MAVGVVISVCALVYTECFPNIITKGTYAKLSQKENQDVKNVLNIIKKAEESETFCYQELYYSNGYELQRHYKITRTRKNLSGEYVYIVTDVGESKVPPYDFLGMMFIFLAGFVVCVILCFMVELADAVFSYLGDVETQKQKGSMRYA